MQALGVAPSATACSTTPSVPLSPTRPPIPAMGFTTKPIRRGPFPDRHDDRFTSAGMGLVRTTPAATLPSAARRAPVRDREVITT